ncbi:M20/M25/M40 family metallo-hydrolase [Klebsiella pneumoniae]|nr:M20/M25/M40 family metallo-hydrolase [Klebsiella pneumoniae]OUK66173.1 hypothetical protein BZY49_15750 [Klebsiella pneumoniae]
MQKKILLVGESWTSTSTHVKGFDQFATATWHTGATDFLAALAESPYAITYMPAHAAATDFPLTLEALQEWDAIILSDIGANTLLLHPDTWLKSRRTANRLTLLHDYVAGGGALMMIGGYYSFQGINGGARYRHTEVEKVLPVRCLAWDDRIETPEGCYAEVTEAHPLFNDIPGEWPWLLGYNEVEMHPEGKLLATVAFADWLDDSGFEVSLSSFGEGRCNLIASLPGAKSGKPLAFTGHLDTVPLGNARWQYDPFGSQMEDGRLYGRGSSDMKAAIAAFAVACVHQREAILAGRGAVLLITGGEETGCDGARALIASATLPEVGALIVGEPTANYPVIGHKGALWLRCETRGKTAHGAMPELGINAIYLAADALGKIQHFSPGAPHPLMKQPTLNVGRIEGGLNINSVPDRTRFDVDIRSAPNLQHATIRERLTTLLGESVTVSTLVDLPAVLSREDHAWIKQVYQRCQPLHAEPIAPRVVPYFTDASLLLPALGDPPCIILGPGEPSMAHQTDEYCLLSRLAEAEQLYGDIIRDWMASPPATKVKNE